MNTTNSDMRTRSDAIAFADRFGPMNGLPPSAKKLVMLAFLTHLIFLTVVLLVSWATVARRYIYPDSRSYIVPATNIVQHGEFSREQSAPYLWEPYRTPGYPLLIAMGIWLTGRPEAVLFLAPFFAGLMTYCLILLTWELFLNEKAALVAGGIAALLPGGLGLSVAILTDFIHGCLFIAAFYVTLKAIRLTSWRSAALASAMWAAAQLIRPTLSLAIILIFIMGAWLARKRQQLILVMIMMLLSLPVPGLLSYMNFSAHGVFSPSLVGRATVADYAVLRGKALATGQSYDILRTEAREEDIAAAASANGKSFYGKLYEIQGFRITETVREYRFYLVAGYGAEVVRQILAPWDSILVVTLGQTHPVLRALLGIIYGAFLIFAIWGIWLAAKQGHGATVFVICLTFVFWIATGSISTYVGSRLRFPGELLLIPLVSIGGLRVFEILLDKRSYLVRFKAR